MKTRAAVAWEAGKPLEVEEIELEGPKAGEVLLRNVATGVCHTDAFTLSGEDPEGLFPAVLGHEGGAVVEEIGEGVTSLAVGDHVIPLYTPECGECNFCTSGKTNLCQKIRVTQGQGLMPDGTSRFSKNGQPDFFTTWVLRRSVNTPCCRKSRSLKSARRRRSRKSACSVAASRPALAPCSIRPRSEPGATVAVFGLGGVGLSAIQGATMARAGRIVAIDINEDKFELAKQLGATDTVNPKDYDAPIQDVIVELTGGGVDYSFECVGNVDLMRSALECCHKGWGESVIVGVAGAGQEISTRPFQLVTGRVWRGTAFGGCKGRSQLPGMVEQYMDGDIKIDEFITFTMPLEDINKAFDLMHEGKSIRSVIHF